MTVGAAEDTATEVEINHQLVSGYLNAMKEISEKYGIPNDVSVVSLSRFPDVFTVRKAAEDEEQLTADVLSVADKALASFLAMRGQEGEKLRADILSRAVRVLPEKLRAEWVWRDKKRVLRNKHSCMNKTEK